MEKEVRVGDTALVTVATQGYRHDYDDMPMRGGNYGSHGISR